MAVGFDPDPRFARYPFLEGARTAVERAEFDIPTIVESDRAVVDRAKRRIQSAVEKGTVGTPHRSAAVELLSYPVARVIVSMVDEPALIERYAAAEAATAMQRYWSDRSVSERRTLDRRPLALHDLLAELNLDAVVHPAGDEANGRRWNEHHDAFRVDVGAYLRLSSGLDGDSWRLIRRRLDDGTVPVDGSEFERLLKAALAERVAEDLPLGVPDAVAAPLRPAAAEIRDGLADHDLDVRFETVVPGLFPPCMRALMARMGEDPLPDHSLFALSTFLLGTGLTVEEIIDLTDVSDERAVALETRLDRLGGDGSTQYAAPSCASMQAYGDCVNKDDVCETIAHPLEYYNTRLERADEVTDWRRTRHASAE